MLAFIWVATMVPNLFLGVSSHKIDYDAVAYRTGVILAEDPGATITAVISPWEVQPDSAKENIERFGLAISKDTPNILSEIKVRRFFSSTVFTDDDYRKKAIFGDFPYKFNISLSVVGEQTRMVGEILPPEYGYIRKPVKVKHYSNATINQNVIKKFHFNNSENVTYHDFSIMINTSHLIKGNITNPVTSPVSRPAYEINPLHDKMVITIDDLNQTPPWGDTVGVPHDPAAFGSEFKLTKVAFSTTRYSVPGFTPLMGSTYRNFLYDDGNTTSVEPPVTIKKNLTMVFEPGFFQAADETGAIYINMTFEINQTAYPKGKWFLNNTGHPFDYNYNRTDVTQPSLRDGVLEVAIW
jgi:hypothetical protein